jgi:hypothetical protein
MNQFPFSPTQNPTEIDLAQGGWIKQSSASLNNEPYSQQLPF